MPSVARLWPQSTIVCLGCGPSLTQADVDYVRGQARVIAINDAVQLAPWADVLYACDSKWWGWATHKDSKKPAALRLAVKQFAGLRYALDPNASLHRGVQVLKKGKTNGLALSADTLNTGMNSGHQAINLAYHLGAARIVLLGYDLQRGPKGQSHFFGEHPDRVRPPLHRYAEHFPSLVEPLKQAGVQIVNCSRSTSITCFPKALLEDIVQPLAVAV